MPHKTIPMKHQKSAGLSDHAHALLAGGLSSDRRARLSHFPLFYSHGEGSRIWDVDGNEWIDYVLGHGPSILGHSPPAVQQALREQVDRSVLFGGESEITIQVAQMVCQCVPSAELVRFGTSGSEAVHAALRLARAVTKRQKVIRFEGHYHGWLDNIAWSYTPPIQEAGSREQPSLIPMCAGQTPEDGANLISLPWNDLDIVEDRLKQYPGEIAAVICEPVMFSCGVISPRDGFLEGLRDLCHKHGTVLIFDEVITGFRLSLGGAQEMFGVYPDLTILGKALGGGAAVSCLAGREEVMRHWDKCGVVMAGTYNANPLSMAASLATLKTLTQNSGQAFQTMNERIDRLFRGITEFSQTSRLPLVVRRVGSLMHVSFVPNPQEPIHDYRSFLQTDLPLTDSFTLELSDHGIRTNPSWLISTAHTEKDITETLTWFENALERFESRHQEVSMVGKISTAAPRNPDEQSSKSLSTNEVGQFARFKKSIRKLFQGEPETPQSKCRALFEEYQSKKEEAFEWRQKHPPPNFYWALAWELTHKCNLACSYCPQDHSGYPNEDLEKGIELVCSLQPRFIWVGGGEPTLVPDLGDVIRRVKKECEDPWLVVNTNFLSPEQIYEEISETADGIYISLDGFGKDNWTNRGFNGEKLFKKAVRLIEKFPQVHWAMDTVVTVDNLDTIEAFTHRVQSEIPLLTQNIWPMCPTNHPRSIGRDVDSIARFRSILERLSTDYPHIRYSMPPEHYEQDGCHDSCNPLDRVPDPEELRSCDRQFFHAEIKPDGLLYDCFHRQLCGLDHIAATSLQNEDQDQLLRVLELLELQRDRSTSYNSVCSHPCKVWEDIDCIIHAESTAAPQLRVFPEFAGKFRPQDKDRAVPFIRENMNPDFRREFFDHLGDPRRFAREAQSSIHLRSERDAENRKSSEQTPERGHPTRV